MTAQACRCEHCSPDNPAPTYVQAWRLECEARFVLAMPLAQRKGYLVRIGERRGNAARQALQHEVVRIFNQQ